MRSNRPPDNDDDAHCHPNDMNDYLDWDPPRLQPAYCFACDQTGHRSGFPTIGGREAAVVATVNSGVIHCISGVIRPYSNFARLS
jgi:hypothetical protein